MKIISHRGYWQKIEEKNSSVAFHRSFALGFGTETDLRDLDGEIVVSHDPPRSDSGIISFVQLLEMFCAYDPTLPLALNIKADGLQKPVAKLLQAWNINNYFLFDMSVPDLLVSQRANLICYTRQSEFENIPSLYERAKGVWMDEFFDPWISIDSIKGHIDNGKEVCIVSPELHGRDPVERWSFLESLPSSIQEKCTICTDLPEKARDYFG